jgi:hypothetical protein
VETDALEMTQRTNVRMPETPWAAGELTTELGELTLRELVISGRRHVALHRGSQRLTSWVQS